MASKPIRILFDAHALLGKKTGVGQYTYGIIEALAKEHPDTVELVGYFHNFLYRKKVPPLPAAPNIRYRRIAFMPGQIINLLRRIHILVPIELLTLTRSDFILYPNFLGLASLFKTPSANVIHDLTFVDLPDYVSKRNLHDLQHFIPDNIKRASFLVTVSEFGKKRIHEEFHVPLNDILVTPIPTEPTRTLPDAKKDAILNELKVPSKYFLTLSTVEPRKNVLGMLDAYALLPEKLQAEYTLVIAGAIGWNNNEEMARLKQLAKEGKNVLHLDYVTPEQKAALYQGMTFYTSASHYEGFGMTPLEAMSYGKASALSDILVFKEVAGSAAAYFNKDNAKTIAVAWQRILSDKSYRETLAEKGKKQAAIHTWSDIAASLYNRIKETLEESE